MPSPIQLGPPSFKKALDEQKTLHRGEVWYLSTWQKEVEEKGGMKRRYLIHFHINLTLFSIHFKHMSDNRTLVRTRSTLEERTDSTIRYHEDVFFDEYYLDVAAKYLIHLMFWERLYFSEMTLILPPLGNVRYTECRRCTVFDLTINFKKGSDPALFASWMALIAKRDFFETLSLNSDDEEVYVLVKHVIQVKLAETVDICVITDLDYEFINSFPGKKLIMSFPSQPLPMNAEEVGLLLRKVITKQRLRRRFEFNMIQNSYEDIRNAIIRAGAKFLIGDNDISFMSKYKQLRFKMTKGRLFIERR